MTHPAQAFAVDPAHGGVLLAEMLVHDPLATLFTTIDDETRVEHLPLLLSPDGASLRGHLAGANALIRALAGRDSRTCQYTAVIHGPHHYVSPNWYPSKTDDPRKVPTWNYVAVHVRGTLQLHPEASWIAPELARMTAQFEASVGEDWALMDAPADYRDRLFGAIVGVELGVASISATCKASQNKTADDEAGVHAGAVAAARRFRTDPITLMARLKALAGRRG